MGSRRVVFWDFDGTLAQRDGAWPEVLRDTILAVDPLNAVSVDSLAAGLRAGFPDWAPGEMRVYPDAAAWWAAASRPLITALLGAGIPSEIAGRAIAEVPRIYYQPAHWNTLPGAFRALTQTIDAGFTNVILSNHAPELPVLVDALGFGPLVERTITSASLGIEKPNPTVFRTALQLVDAAVDSWMIGDNPIADVAGARAAGMRALLVHRRETGLKSVTLMDAAAQVIQDGPTG